MWQVCRCCLKIHKVPDIKPNMKYHHEYVDMFSAATFLWFNWVFNLGYKQPLEIEDLGCLPKQFTSKFNRYQFNKALKMEKVSWTQEPGPIASDFFHTLQDFGIFFSVVITSWWILQLKNVRFGRLMKIPEVQWISLNLTKRIILSTHPNFMTRLNLS